MFSHLSKMSAIGYWLRPGENPVSIIIITITTTTPSTDINYHHHHHR